MLELKDRKHLSDVALAQGATNAYVISTRSIKIGYWPRWKCQFGCPNYGKSLCCPPYAPSYEATRIMLDEYCIAMLVQCASHFDPVKTQWLDAYKQLGKTMDNVLLKTEKTAFLMDYYRAFSMKATFCDRCKTCNLVRCVNTIEARPLAEACGIDVMALAKENGFESKIMTEITGDLSIYGLVLID